MHQQGAIVESLWWDGNDLHVITKDGEHTLYKSPEMIVRRINIPGENYIQKTASSTQVEIMEAEGLLEANMDTLRETLSGLEGLQERLSKLVRN